VRPVAFALAAVLSLGAASRARAEALTLDEALAVAARASPDLAIARADAESAAAEPVAGAGLLLPRLDLSASSGHDFTGPGAGRLVVQGVAIPVGTSAEDRESNGLSLRLAQTVFDWAALRDLARARSSARAAARQYDEAALSTAFEVTRRFYEAVRAERTLAVLERTVVRSEDLVSRSDALFTAGRAPKSDGIQARANLANDRVAVEAQRIRVAQARNALAQVLGRSDGVELAVVPPAALDAPSAADAEPPPLDALLATARTRRPALAAQAALVDAAEAAAGAARAGYLPTLSAQASYARQGYALGAPEAVYGDPSRAYTANAQLVLAWNLFEGRRTLAATRRADAQARRARAVGERTAAQVTQEIANARASVVALGRQVAIAREGLAVAGQGLGLARERLDAGLANQLEIRDASLKATQAELSLVQARIDEAVARADLARATGGPL
jgi:outer membrane protein TolC